MVGLNKVVCDCVLWRSGSHWYAGNWKSCNVCRIFSVKAIFETRESRPKLISSTREQNFQKCPALILRDLPLCHESEAKIFLATINCRRLILRIDGNNVYAWLHSYLLHCTRMDIYAHQSCVKMHLFLVCRATPTHAIHVAPANQRRLAACTGIIRGRLKVSSLC